MIELEAMMEDRHITLAHGNGGRYMRELGTEEITRRLEELTGRSVKQVLDAGVGFVPEDRKEGRGQGRRLEVERRSVGRNAARLYGGEVPAVAGVAVS